MYVNQRWFSNAAKDENELKHLKCVGLNYLYKKAAFPSQTTKGIYRGGKKILQSNYFHTQIVPAIKQNLETFNIEMNCIKHSTRKS